MAELEDELDSKYHRGIKSDVYYRVPTTEALDGALQNELQKNAASLIPVETISEFVFSHSSSITVPPTQQENLGDLGIAPADFAQSVTVEQALCSDIENAKARLVIQRAVARSILDAIQCIDGFKYCENQATYKDGSDGTRFKYVCVDSLQNRDRKANKRKSSGVGEQNSEEKGPKAPRLPTYDCGGAVYIKFSIKRDAINVVYKHNPIHRDIESQSRPGTVHWNSEPAQHDMQQDMQHNYQHDYQNYAPEPSDASAKPKRKRRTKAEMEAARANGYHAADIDMATSPDTNRSPAKKKKKRTENGAVGSSASGKKQKQGSQQHMNASMLDTPTPPPPAPLKTKGTCVRCREKKIQCDEVQPTCNQCQRGLWTCEWRIPKPRDKTSCSTCKLKKRKCIEERPSFAYCTRHHEECEYPFAA